MHKFEVTLADLRKAETCVDGYNKVVFALKGEPFKERDTYLRFAHKEPISLLSILETNGLDDALWALRCVKNADRDLRLYAVWCARQVEHLMTDQRSKDALDVVERFADGLASVEELDAARAAAARAAWDAAWAAARAARAAAWDAARAAARADAAGAAARAAWDAAWAYQKEMFIKMCNGQAPWQEGQNV